MNSPLDIYWMVGFIEGDGCFNGSKDKYGRTVLSLIVRQADPLVLYKLKKHFSFGSVYQDKDGYWTWCVRGPVPLQTLIKLLNGRLVLKKRLKQFIPWMMLYNQKHGTSFVPQTVPAPVTLKNAWLTGFADAEGSFSIFLSRRKDTGTDRLRIRFYLDQADALDTLKVIQKELGGTLILRRGKKGNMCHRLMVDTWKKSHEVMAYFTQFPPLSTTLFVRWIRYGRVYRWYVSKEWVHKKAQILHLITLNQRLKKKKLFSSNLAKKPLQIRLKI